MIHRLASGATAMTAVFFFWSASSCAFVPPIGTRERPPTAVAARDKPEKNKDPISHDNTGDLSPLCTRRRGALLSTMVVTGYSFVSVSAPPSTSFAFEGGVGGLGKTKPETGVALMDGSNPIQNSQGIVSAEIMVGEAERAPVRIDFTTPWPLLPTASGLEARSLRQPESAFVQVVEATSVIKDVSDWKQIKTTIIDNVMGTQGKFGAYGQPTDIKIAAVEKDLYLVTFTALTPSLRESDRKLFIKVKQVRPKTLVLLVTGTTAQRFSSQQQTLRDVADSFMAIPAPPRK